MDNMAWLTNKQKSELFRELVKVSAYQAGIRMGLDKFYKNKWSLIAFVRKAEKEVRANPAKFGISQDTIEMLDASLAERKSKKVAVIGQELAKTPEISFAELDVKSLVDTASKKSLLLLHRRMDMLLDSKKQLKAVPLAALANVVGITFDKRQITKGEATEHVEMRSKIEIENKTPAEALTLLLNMREKMLTENNGN